MGIAAWALVISILAAVTSISSLAWQIVVWRKAVHDVHIGGRFGGAGQEILLILNVFNHGRGEVGLVDAWLEYGEDDGMDLKKKLDLPETLSGHDGREWEVPMFDDVLAWSDVTVFVRLGTGKLVQGQISTDNWTRSKTA